MSNIYFSVDKDGLTGQIQLSLNDRSRDTGHRLGGPKYNGSSNQLAAFALGDQDIEEIERYLAIAKEAK